jgi:hypothetical protein
VAPRPSVDSAQILPPWRVKILNTVARPTPVPANALSSEI